MTLPLSRNTTYAVGSQIKSADLNALQDGEIAGKHGPLTLWFQAVGARVNTNMLFGDGYMETSADAGVINDKPFQIIEGTSIVGIKCRLRGTGVAGTCTLDVRRWLGDGTSDFLTRLNIVDPPATWATYSVSFAAAVTLTAQSFGWYCTLAKIGQRVSSFGLVIQRT